METEWDRKQGGGSEEGGEQKRGEEGEEQREGRGVPGKAHSRHQVHTPQLDCVRSHTKM